MVGLLDLSSDPPPPAISFPPPPSFPSFPYRVLGQFYLEYGTNVSLPRDEVRVNDASEQVRRNASRLASIPSDLRGSVVYRTSSKGNETLGILRRWLVFLVVSDL